LLTIAAVERDTGLGKDTLRVWERRYGFPAPRRDAIGERLYAPADLHKLRVVKRLLDAGHRPGRVVGLPLDELQRLAQPLPATAGRAAPDDASADSGIELSPLLALLRAHDLDMLRHRLAWLLTQLGLARFTLEIVAPLTRAVGDAWSRGELEVFEEHQYTELVQRVLRQAIGAVPQPAAGAQRVLLTTVPGEPHGLGLLMAEAMLALEGCRCVSLGVQTPLPEIAAAASVHRADAVALSFSTLMTPKAVVDTLRELRRRLPSRVQLWAGGAAPVVQRRAIEGVLPITALQAIPEHARRLRRPGTGDAPMTGPPHP
jgi:DNA-binding transcriptional MerR regulator/methylmalonyl-CoA mutase cobalamin-binding subunit